MLSYLGLYEYVNSILKGISGKKMNKQLQLKKLNRDLFAIFLFPLKFQQRKVNLIKSEPKD